MDNPLVVLDSFGVAFQDVDLINVKKELEKGVFNTIY